MPERLTRAAVVGAATLLGKELVAELGAGITAVWDLTLLDEGEDAEGQLTTAGDEATVIHSLSAEALRGADIVFFAGLPAFTRQYGQIAIGNGSAVVDLTAALEDEPGFLLRSPWLHTGSRPDLTTLGVVTPHPIALLLALVADALKAAFGPSTMAATVLEPASQAGNAGVDELHQQTVGLLSFHEVPKTVFDAQVAFNVQGALGPAAHASLSTVASTLEHQVSQLTAAPESTVTLNLLQAPVFHGYFLSILLTLEKAADEASLRSSLDTGILVPDAETPPSNQAAVESGKVLLALKPASGNGSRYWLTLAADNLRLAAQNAIATALELAALRPGSRVQ